MSNKINAVVVKREVVGDLAIVLNEEIASEATALLDMAEMYTEIDSPEKFKAADLLAGQIRKVEKQIEDHRLELTTPLEKFKKQIIAAADGVVKTLAGARRKLGDKIMDYQQEQERIRREAEAKAEKERKDAEEKERKRQEEINAALEKNDFPAAELHAEPVRPAPVAIAPVVKSSSFKAVSRKVLHIYDAAQLPRAYLVPDEVSIRSDLLAGKTIPGARLDEEMKAEGK